MDFLIAIVVLTTILGFSVHSLDLAQKSLASYRAYQSNAAQTIADSNASVSALFAAPQHCVTLRDSSSVLSDNCSSKTYPPGVNTKDFFEYCASTTGNVFSGRRLVACPSGAARACILEARTCE